MPTYTVVTEGRATFEQQVEADSREEAIALTENMDLGKPVEVANTEVVGVTEDDEDEE